MLELDNQRKPLTQGIVMWLCLALGIVVAIVGLFGWHQVKQSDWNQRRELSGILRREQARVRAGTGDPAIVTWLSKQV